MMAELIQRLSGIEDGLREVALGQRGLSEGQRIISEQQARLIELLTPKEKPKQDGPRLDELLAAMIVRMDTQNHLLKDTSDVVSKGMTTLPLLVVRAIADAFPPAEEPAQPPSRNGHGRGQA